MKKKIMALCLSSAMMLSAATSVFADTADGLKTELGSGQKVEYTDIKIKATPTSVLVGGKFNFEAVVSDAPVRAKMAEYKTALETVLKGGDASRDVSAEVAAFLADCTIKEDPNAFVVTIKCDKPEILDYTTAVATFTAPSDIFTYTINPIVNGEMTIDVGVKSGVTYNVLDEKLANLNFTYTGVMGKAVGECIISSTVAGKTTIMNSGSSLADVTYTFNDAATTVYVTTQGTGGSIGTPKKTLTIVIAEGIDNKEHKYDVGKVLGADEIVVPTRPGYKFAGFYYDAELTKPVEGEITLNENMTIYTKWEEEPVVSPFDGEEHYAYIIGYPTEDGKEIVKPEANITREETATIYYRLLKDEIREELFKDTNDFIDVATDRWSNKAISTMANGDYITGYEDGSFKPASDITRAEFVTIAARFFGVDAESSVVNSTLTDIDAHWAKTYINYAVSQNWLAGYEDGTFRPDRYITRAEVMKIVNNILKRHVNDEGLVEAVKIWDDNDPDAWYYYDVIEATNPHTYEKAEGEETGNWIAITENKVWTDKPVYEDAE